MRNKLEFEINATTQDPGECTRDDMNKLANGLVHTLTQAAKVFLKHSNTETVIKKRGGGGGERNQTRCGSTKTAT